MICGKQEEVEHGGGPERRRFQVHVSQRLAVRAQFPFLPSVVVCVFVSANSLHPTSRHLSRFALLRRRVARLHNQRMSADSHPAPTGCGVFFALKRIEDKPAGWLSGAKKEREKLEPRVTLESSWIIWFRILDFIHLVRSPKKPFL